MRFAAAKHRCQKLMRGRALMSKAIACEGLMRAWWPRGGAAVLQTQRAADDGGAQQRATRARQAWAQFAIGAILPSVSAKTPAVKGRSEPVRESSATRDGEPARGQPRSATAMVD